ncbi:hypothetical protein HDK77DRAFT_494118 [Phyllosticta capitalensis]
MDGSSDLHEGLIEFVVDGGFKAKWHTDLTIRCQGREFFVHKIILGAQSQYLRKACDPNSPFQEAKTGIIDLVDEDPDLVRVMLDFCYSNDLDYSLDCQLFCKHDGFCYRNAMCHARLYAMGDKYQLIRLKDHTAEALKLYLEGKLANEKDETQATEFRRLARVVYATTPNTDRGLRDLLLYFASTNIDKLMQERSFKAKIDKIDGFWGELAQYTTETRERSRRCPNPECLKTSIQSFPAWLVRGKYRAWLKCPHCKQGNNFAEWNKLRGAEKDTDSESSSDEETESRKRKRDHRSPELGTDVAPVKHRKLQVCDGV